MAPVLAAVPPGIPSKIKRSIPPGIQTNGVNSSKSSPSPSMSTKPPPSTAQQQPPPNPPASNGAASNATPRPASRPRKDIPLQVLGRGQRSAGLGSASMAPEPGTAPAVEPIPYIRTKESILQKFAGNPPSLIVHLFPTHFRFDNQEGIFPYTSPMKVFLEHVKTRTIPHELLKEFNDAGVPFYDGCLIVQLYSHQPVAHSKEVARPSSASTSKTVSNSIHNHNPYITPSPYAPYPNDNPPTTGENGATPGPEQAEKTEDQKDKESMPAPSLPTEGQKKTAPKPRITTCVLFPTQQALQKDLALRAITPRSAPDSRQDGAGSAQTPGVPPTPTAASMPPPAKRQKREGIELDGTTIYQAEAEILLQTTPALYLEPTRNADETRLVLEALSHPEHSEKPPQPKTRKRTVAEMAADEAVAAEQERYMLTMDERQGSKAMGAKGAVNGGDVDGQTGAAAWEPRFERFKLIDEIKEEHKARKEQERAENERKLALQKQQQQAAQQQVEQQAQLLAQQAQQRAQEDRQRSEQALLQRQRQEAQQRNMQARAQAQAAQQQQQQQQQAHAALAQNQAAQAQAAQAQQNALAASMAQAAHGHPAVSGPMVNGMPNGIPTSMAAQAQARFHQVSQAQASSPIVGQNTPQHMSSPMVGNAAMQRSNSSMAGSPPRAPSVVNHQPMSTPMAVSMSARGSQQSHPSGTPRMPNSTPNMAHTTPMSRPQVIQTPRMTQGSPPPNMMTQAQQVGQAMLMNGQALPPQMQNQNLIAAQIAAQQQRLQQQQQLQQAMQNGMMPGTPNPSQLAAQQQMMAQQRLAQQQLLLHQRNRALANQQMMGNNPQAQLAQQYQQQLSNMQNNMQMHGGQMQTPIQRQMAAMQAQGMGTPNGLNLNNLNQAQQIAIMQQLQQQQQAAQAQAQQQQQQQQQAQQLQAQQQQEQQQQQAQQMGQAGGQGQAMTPYIQNQIRQNQMALYQRNFPSLVQKFGGQQNIPQEATEQLKKSCYMKASQNVMQMIRQQQQQQLQQQLQQQQQQQQQGMNGMNGMNGMGQGM